MTSARSAEPVSEGEPGSEPDDGQAHRCDPPRHASLGRASSAADLRNRTGVWCRARPRRVLRPCWCVVGNYRCAVGRRVVGNDNLPRRGPGPWPRLLDVSLIRGDWLPRSVVHVALQQTSNEEQGQACGEKYESGVVAEEGAFVWRRNPHQYRSGDEEYRGEPAERARRFTVWGIIRMPESRDGSIRSWTL